MANIIKQTYMPLPKGTLVATLVKKTSNASETVTLPQMVAATNSVVQLRRQGDAASTVTQVLITTCTVTGAKDAEVLLLSWSLAPVTNPV